jgi:hypothetical protein
MNGLNKMYCCRMDGKEREGVGGGYIVLKDGREGLTSPNQKP